MEFGIDTTQRGIVGVWCILRVGSFGSSVYHRYVEHRYLSRHRSLCFRLPIMLHRMLAQSHLVHATENESRLWLFSDWRPPIVLSGVQFRFPCFYHIDLFLIDGYKVYRVCNAPRKLRLMRNVHCELETWTRATAIALYDTITRSGTRRLLVWREKKTFPEIRPCFGHLWREGDVGNM